PEHLRIRPVLQTLAESFGETAHFAVLEDDMVVYRAKVDASTGAARVTSAVGSRNPAHATGVGTILLSYALHKRQDVKEWVGERVLEKQAENTATSTTELLSRLSAARKAGYALDDQENERGVNCIAFPVSLGSP